MVLSIFACSTEKDALINRGFHNMTARYNGYFNAGEIINESLTVYREKTKDDYTKLLPLDLYPNEETVSAMFPEMDLAIEKCSKVIYRHAMPNPIRVKDKDVENCAWIDDNWLVIGKSHYIKKEYTEAIEKFTYIKKAYTGEESIYAAKIWLAKTYTEQGQFSKAKIELDKVTLDIKIAKENEKSIKEIFEKKEKGKKKPSRYQKKKAKKLKKENKNNEPAKFPDNLKSEYEITFANLYIEQKEYKKAIVHLEEGIKLTKDKRQKARYMYVLAQLYQKNGDGNNAVYYYTKVSKSNAPYEMRFYAKINKALSATTGGIELRKDLFKMLKDGKNEEYKDQIYYVLAELDLKDGNVASAKTYLSNSVFYSINNDRQKGMSYLKLADLHFSEKDYIKAQKYYDSCVTALPKSYENYASIKSKANGLSDLVLNYEVVQRQDSLQKIAFMPEKEREKFLKETLKQIKEDEKRKKAEAEARLLALQKRINNAQANNGGGSKWYFYNQKAIGNGFNEFRANWGQKALEDDWRRSNKESILNIEEIEADSTEAYVEEGLTVDILRADLPLTKEDVDTSNIMILDALYNLGIIYKEQLKENIEAIGYFTNVIDRKIKHEKVLPSAYQLYLIYKKSGDSKSNIYKNIILNDYENSDIAKLVLDPDYLKNKKLSDRKDLDDYSDALKDYDYRRYMKVITQCNDVILNRANNKYINKYYLLKAFAISKSNIGGIEIIKKPLIELYTLSPDSEEGIQAKKYLDQIKDGESILLPNGIGSGGTGAGPVYIKNGLQKHYFILIFPNTRGDINPVKINISNFNTTFFKSNELKLSNGIIGIDNQSIMVKTFDNQKQALIYFRSFGADTSQEILGKTASNFEYFIITKNNYSIFYNGRDIEGYTKFFKENYE